MTEEEKAELLSWWKEEYHRRMEQEQLQTNYEDDLPF